MRPKPGTLITSLLEALHLLKVGWNSRTTAEFHLPLDWAEAGHIWKQPRIVRDSFCGPYDSHSGQEEWPVSEEVARQLMTLTKGKPQWGYTAEKERIPTQLAWMRLNELEREINTGEAI